MNIHDLYRPFLHYFRTKRMQRFSHLFKVTEATRVLDVGGDWFNWSLVSAMPSLTIVNLYLPKKQKDAITWIIADGRHLPFKEGAFDVAYSNSVIEHLGDLTSQQAFAQEIKRVGRRYFVQTPNKWFLVEPHLLTPFIHWLPRSVQKRLLRYFTVWGLVTRPSEAECKRFLDEVRLLDRQQVGALFPQALVLKERILGITKSFIAFR